MKSTPSYSAAADKYSSYGPKTLYQIKSVISIVNHKYSVDITYNEFT
jgi:hypothetical protein